MIPVTVTFYGDVGFDRSYNHVIDFSDETERSNYFDERIIKTVQDCAYNKPINSIQLKCPYEDALNFTYCKFVMGSNPNNQKTIYAWVDDVVLITDQYSETLEQFIPIIEISISVDPWQTFLFDFTLGESFVAREHVDRFKNNNLDNTTGWCLPNTTDKSNVGLTRRKTKLSNLVNEVGVYKYTESGSTGSELSKPIHFLIVQGLTVGDNPEEVIHLVPFADDNYCIATIDSQTVWGRTLTIEDVYSGKYLTILGIDPEKVINVALIPFDYYTAVGFHDVSYDGHTFRCQTIYFGDGFFEPFSIHGMVPTYDYISYVMNVEGHDLPIKLTKYVQIDNCGLRKPTSQTQFYDDRYEPQLYKQPYRYVSIIGNNGEEKGYLPDVVSSNSYGTQKIGMELYILIDSVDIRLRIVPDIAGTSIDLANDYWTEFSLTQVDVASANWFSYMVQQRDADRAMIASQAVQGAIASAIGGVSGSINMGGQESYGIRKSQAAGNETGFTAGQGFKQVAGIGLGAAGIGTVGGFITSTVFGFQQQDIRESAIKNKANSIISAGTFKSIVNYDLQFYLMECDATSINIKSKEFHKYGYSVFRYETPNIKSRKYFNFIATNIVKIEGSLNNNIKIALSQIFNNGVTIWHGDYINELTGIGDYSKENIERSLI